MRVKTRVDRWPEDTPIGAAADLFGKARLMIGCLVLLGLANIPRNTDPGGHRLRRGISGGAGIDE
jgi:hypothetical protein